MDGGRGRRKHLVLKANDNNDDDNEEDIIIYIGNSGNDADIMFGGHDGHCRFPQRNREDPYRREP